MKKKWIVSDQYVNWSDNEVINDYSAPTAAQLGPAIDLRGEDLAGFFDRALQTLREAGVKMLEGARSWSQVLSFGESQPSAAADGLRSLSLLPGGSRVAGKLPAGPTGFGADLSDQSRVVATPGEAVGEGREGSRGSVLSSGCEVSREAGRQYAAGVARRGGHRARVWGGGVR